MKKYLFVSVKEQYVTKILDGSKLIELRKSKPNILPGDDIIIYCTSPIKAIVATATIENIIVHTPQQMWKLHSKKLGINKNSYDAYFLDCTRAIGIELSNVRKLSLKIDLIKIKLLLPNFSPPQTYQYYLNCIFPDDTDKIEMTPFRTESRSVVMR